MTGAKLDQLMGDLSLGDDTDSSQHGDSDASFMDDFHELAKVRKWKIGSKAWRKNWAVFMQAEKERLSRNHDARLERWKQMCVKLGIKPAESIKKCRLALSHVFVNLVDVMECWATGSGPRKFGSARQLAEYTQREGKFFSRNLVKQDQVLRVLMKHLA
ncbi:uncharacterized protein N7477_005190 [Penicillium maclennaniae]|uniref:uncharacterized protein n=1 Tax=Penicillium maclennaniae TaxID=1343394 RepID=UPI00254166C7|nr:uncharacterized protein N7477_005190 [Penicillium maclennaniae]KAJ5675256.1 hypothetical protein N7477_005190 [Penicillium maclennaniae]